MDSNFVRRVAEAKQAMRRMPVHSLSELWELDPVEIVEGYKDGYEGFPCSDNRSRAYWHGWRNSQIDKHAIPTDWQSSMLMAQCTAYGGLMKVVEDHPGKYEWLKRLGLAEPTR